MAKQKRVTQCPECHAPVAHRRALTCGKCAAQLYYPKRSLVGWVFVWLFFAFNGYMLVRLGFTGLGLFRTYSTVSSPTGAAGTAGAGFTVSTTAATVVSLFFEWFIGFFFIGILVLMTKPRVRL
ncbi:MAG: hypothetical protein MPK62_14760 [Alphaproteobacteria bacterium]|nr:hypothetical protein [Alphaproteobacteria bacterium]